MKLATAVCLTACWFGVVCRRTSVVKPHRDVATSQGTVRGYLTPTHAAYFGIPYAGSPTQGDRFKAPEPPPTWDGIFEASQKIKCPQQGEDGEENCLVINVFAPRDVTLLPVYVILHDGDLTSGWGTYRPPVRLLKDGYVVVTFNYRLGALGFLCLNTPDAPGNAGLKDQVAAFYWINGNIEYFGGNPDEVIVHGVGSAAVSIQLLLLSGLVDGLIHKVIVESGSILSPSAMTYDPIALAYEAATAIGYDGTDDVGEMYKFYEEASWQELVDIPIKFLPCVEDKSHSPAFLVYFDPLQRLREGQYQQVPILITYTDTVEIGNMTDSFQEPEDIAKLLPSNLEFNGSVIEEKVGQIVKDFYFGNELHSTEDLEQIYFEYRYDVLVEYPMVNWAMLYASGGSHMVYLMKFIHDSTGGVDESAILSSGTFLETLYFTDDDDNVVLDKVLTLWRNFLKMGDPTPIKTSILPVIWQPVVTEKRNPHAIATVPTLHFSYNRLEISAPPKNQKLIFWDNIYGKFSKKHTVTQDISEDLDDND